MDRECEPFPLGWLLLYAPPGSLPELSEKSQGGEVPTEDQDEESV